MASCPMCHGTRQAFPVVDGVLMHADNSCPLCDLQGEGWGGVLEGDVLTRLAEMRPETVSCVVTSPPYWSLRKYDAPDVVWGGDPECLHEWGDIVMGGESYNNAIRWEHGDPDKAKSRKDFPDAWQKETPQGQFCVRCGCWRGQFGLEPTPELYVEHTLDVLRGIRRVLRPDGVVFWNIGDGYSGSGQGWNSRLSVVPEHQKKEDWLAPPARDRSGRYGLKPKDLVLMPFRVALAAQADGWWVRSVIIWSKPNAMPESTKDRPTTAHEYILMLTKQARYWWDQEAVREKTVSLDLDHISYRPNSAEIARDGRKEYHDGKNDVSARSYNPAGRNLRSVWEFPTAQTPEAHFATFPPELPRRCIEAACPREVCARCGMARVRLVEEHLVPTKKAAKTFVVDERDAAADDNDQGSNRQKDGHKPGYIRADSTIGWSDCDCEEPDYQPGIVLDPFAGVGTTLYVARQLGRRAIGIELSKTYAQMARDKLATWWAPGNLAPRTAPAGQERML